MGRAHTPVSRGRERRFDQIANRFRRWRSRPTGIELFDRLDRRKPLRSRIVHRVEIFVSEQGEEDRHHQSRDGRRLLAHRRKRKQPADDENVEVPVRLHRGRALEVKLNQVVVIHNGEFGLLSSESFGGEEKSFSEKPKAASRENETAGNIDDVMLIGENRRNGDEREPGNYRRATKAASVAEVNINKDQHKRRVQRR